MTHYTHRWDCEKCGTQQETIDRPRVRLCDRCDEQTKVRCQICHKPTGISPAVLRRNHASYAIHHGCALVVDP